MGPQEALEASRILGARTLVPFHYGIKSRSLLIQTPYSEEDLVRLARHAPDLDVVCLPTGTRWKMGTGSFSAPCPPAVREKYDAGGVPAGVESEDARLRT